MLQIEQHQGRPKIYKYTVSFDVIARNETQAREFLNDMIDVAIRNSKYISSHYDSVLFNGTEEIAS